ncbi:YitT family protein [Gemella cuniculi]|uniref:YitT family protein n=1 Tax=Gemella cuniculi TaxID=150240 RepID=UPI0004273ADE|nr:YitT family protein [Gemella cuniculi]
MKLDFKSINKKKITKELFFIALGCAVYSFSLLHFNVPNKLAEGGGAGVALFFLYAFGLPVSYGTLLVNIPLLVLGYKMLDKKTMIYTIYGILMLTFWIKIFETYHVVIDIGGDRLLASVFGGIIAGTGLGIVFVFGGTTGGVDIIAKIFQVYFGFSVGRVIQILDGIILLFTFMVLKSFPAILYTLIYIYICTKIIDYLIEGGIPGKGVMIMSPKIEEITQKVYTDMDRGLTFIKGQGSYSRKDMNIGYCVVSRSEVARLKSLVYAVDPNAFVTISDVHDIIGQGFSFDQPKKRKFKFKKNK